MTNDKHIELSLEHICEQGCRAVNKVINQLKKGEMIEMTRHLNELQQEILLKELKSIMAVYGETGSCELKT